MKALPTEYEGVLFRSRLEAKWAYFFDLLGIDWEYEPEGYELTDGTRYLPDFLVNWSGRDGCPYEAGSAYVEIKPRGDPFIKARKFREECGKQVWLCAGEPTVKPWISLLSFTDDEGTRNVIEDKIVFHPGKHRPWGMPSGEECKEMLSDAARLVRVHHFWDPR